MPKSTKSKSRSVTRNANFGTCGPNDPKKSVNLTQKKSTPGTNSGRDDRGGSSSPRVDTVTTKPLNFEVSCSGLKPNTKHDFYYKNNKLTDECRSLMPGQNVGTTTLISDASGKLQFKFQLAVRAISSKSRASTTVNIQEPPGDALFEVRGENSSARALVQFKDF